MEEETKLRCRFCGEIIDDDGRQALDHMVKKHYAFICNFVKSFFGIISWNEKMQEAYDLYINDAIKDLKERW